MKLSSFTTRAEVFVAKPTYWQFCLFQISEYTVNICAIGSFKSRWEWWCRVELPKIHLFKSIDSFRNVKENISCIELLQSVLNDDTLMPTNMSRTRVDLPWLTPELKKRNVKWKDGSMTVSKTQWTLLMKCSTKKPRNQQSRNWNSHVGST